jgi:energy-converting hydrogenase Eha subunit E
VSRPGRIWLLAVALLFLARVSYAHNPDTSYARFVIGSDRLAVRLTFDVHTLQRIADLDPDRDQRVTPAELQAAAPRIDRFLRDRVRLELDGRAAPLDSAASLVAFSYQQSWPHPAREVTVLFDVFEDLGLRHLVLGAFEYAGHSQEVTFTQPEPDYLFDTSYAATAAPDRAPAPKHRSLTTTLARFFRLGVEHIFLGYDHLCFLLALVVASRMRELVKIVTSFTVAHSITLILAALEIARLPSRLVECAIAATIVYVAAENLFRQSTSHRWALTFGFGLIHGFGFANVLAELGLPTVGRVRCLLAFNVGVEFGQLAIVAAIFPFIVLVTRGRHGARVRAVISIAVGVFGLGWLVERALGLGFMPL